MRNTYSLILLGIALVGAMSFDTNKIHESKKGYDIGDTVEDFKLKDTDDQWVSLNAYKKEKGVIVVFTCNTCPYAKMYENRIIELNRKYSSKGFPLLAINPNDILKKPLDGIVEMKKVAHEKGYDFPYLKDPNQQIATKFGATKTPHVYVLSNKDDKLVVEFIGAIDNNHADEGGVTKRYVEDAVDSLIDGKEVKTKEVKAIGCTIKWTES